ncbi:membrane protein containing Extracellular ligand-binding receptor domain protein [Candidatus Magnetomorum sp. HK-1]|nr:membrane protein containing Extracellular ligand-binding receptor domain protein [Candidatus Magnetomorum sp. HK-1]
MKKYIIISVILAIIVIASIYLTKTPDKYHKEETIDLALVSTTSEKIGQEMIDGASLYVNEINQKGGLFGKEIRLHVFDDMGKSRKATHIATRISESNKILLVLGHSNNECSIAAGRIYKKVGIPAIAASATSELVTLDNEWFYRIIPNDEFQAKFIANYIYRSLKIKSACIIHDSDDFGKILSTSFYSEASKIGLHIKQKWQFHKKSESLSKDLKKILMSLRSVHNPGILFLATDSAYASQLIESINYPKAKLKIIGTYELTQPSFLKSMRKNLMEQNYPGYFSDGIYAILPYMSELSDTDGVHFLKHYLQTYQRKPSWFAASYYDACKLAIEAIKKSGIQDAAIGKKRMDIKDALQSMYHIDYAVKGAMGHHFFNHNGDIQAPIKVGKYHKQAFIPDYCDYRIDTDNTHSHDMGAQIINGEKIIIDGLKMNKAQVVYTGISVNKINNLNIKKKTCTYDFFIWFKYKDAFDPSNIIFENAVNPIKLENPVLEKKDDVKICSFHIVADFKQNFNFRAYPFDYQVLEINYRHKTLIDDKLILVIDRDHQKLAYDENKKNKKLDISSGWNLIGEYLYQDIVTHESRTNSKKSSVLSKEASYSQVNYRTRVKRVNLSGVVRNFFPIIAMILLSTLIMFLPRQKIAIKMILISAVLISNAVYHVSFFSALNATTYITAIEYIHIGFYFVLIYISLASVILYYLHTKKSQKPIFYLHFISGFFYVCIMIGLGYLAYSFIESINLKEIWWNCYHI